MLRRVPTYHGREGGMLRRVLPVLLRMGDPSAQSGARSPMLGGPSAQSVARSPMGEGPSAQSVARSPMCTSVCAECCRSPCVREASMRRIVLPSYV